ncbi:hypothetical protein [Kineosporia babensis]|uniref:Secreted protein n=1 Tax=Kineosporia babensis TaxID=499548 RepID=A0A9X1NG23_9ACTN|nr:hypothetical protein [Kineosporia babensis]MCD5313244.1 hypothetical protein [Kineosporia babensis]
MATQLKRRRTLAGLAAAMVLGAGLVTTSAGTAQAATNCGSTVWPDVYQNVREVMPSDFFGRHIVLRNGRASDASYAAIATGYHSSDRVWIDRKAPGSSSWFQCGPFSRSTSNRMDNFGWTMRACADVIYNNKRVHKCTGWYTDRG